jgi:hypothetical protein
VKKLIAAAAFIIPLGISVFLFPEGLTALLICLPFITFALLVLRRNESHAAFLIPLFISAFLVRILVAAFIFGNDLQPFFGEDSLVHEAHGFMLYEVWNGAIPMPYVLQDWNKPWGIHILIASVYSLIGRNPLAISFLSCFCGAVTAVVIYLCTYRIYRNSRAARVAGYLASFFPAMIIWSAQIMKDGFVVFFVVLVIYFLIKLQEEFSWGGLVLLLSCMAGIFSVRFYIFYFAAFAWVGSFVFGGQRLVASNLRGLVIMSFLALAMAYTGVLTIGVEQVDRLTNLDAMQYSRMALSNDAASGYGSETNITTAGGAITAFPVGLANLLLAPFPWQFNSVRSALPLPEMLVWWALIPVLFIGM